MSKIMPPQQSQALVSSGDERVDADNQIQLLPAARKRDVAFNLALFIVPMLTIPIVLLAFVFYTKQHPVFDAKSTPELPTVDVDVRGKYTTDISATALVLVGSWASSAAQFVMAPFMVLFSFIIAKSMRTSYVRVESDEIQQVLHIGSEEIRRVNDVARAEMPGQETQPGAGELVRGISKAVIGDIIDGLVLYMFGKRRDLSHAARIAVLGGVLSVIFTILLIVGDNILHLAVESIPAAVYLDVVQPNGSNLYDDYSLASFRPIQTCASMLQSTAPSNDSNIFPCSIGNTNGLLNLANAVNAYSVLDEGISEQTGSFMMDIDDFRDYSRALLDGASSETQIVTYMDPKTTLSHALLFNMAAATSFSGFPNGTYNSSEKISYFGTDFAASTISMVTQCLPVTQACGMQSVDPDSPTDANNFSVPFNCSPIFSGDVWQSPTDGLQQFRGWHSKFFDTKAGVAVETLASSQLNPFYWNVTAALTSTDFDNFKRVNDTQISSGAVVDVGHGRLGLAMACEATVYNVNYSMVNYQIHSFQATRADPRLASIIKAPLQVGFGRHELYIRAQVALMLNGITVADDMGDRFSQIGMALASGAFERDYSYAQRVRYHTIITTVPSHALWFIVVVCFLYTAIGLGFGVIAFVVQRSTQYAEYQARIVPVVRFSFRDSVMEPGSKAVGKAQELYNATK